MTCPGLPHPIPVEFGDNSQAGPLACYHQQMSEFCMFLLMIGYGHDTCMPAPPPPLSSYPGFVVLYDPALADLGEQWSHNCQEPCDITANGGNVADGYGHWAACHPDLMGQRVRLTDEAGREIGVFKCMDTGGALLEPVYHKAAGREVIYFDLLWPLTNEDGDGIIDRGQLPWFTNTVVSWAVITP